MPAPPSGGPLAAHVIAAATRRSPTLGTAGRRLLCTVPREGAHSVHFRNSQSVHPLGVEKRAPPAGEWVNPTVNHVWTSDEIKERLATQPRHQPETLADHACVGFLRAAYWT